MKKILAAATLSMVMFPAAQALADQDIGCGLGTMIFEGKSGLAPKVLGATTNGISGNQSFGITFGTLGCQADGVITSREKLAMFIDGNMDNLARDMAKGQGESLSTLAAVWGVEAKDQQAFNDMARSNFARIFADENVTSKDVLDNLNAVVAQDAQLSVYTLS
ncbi:DUF3015 domain-containing protein [Parasalinivibrio latis]|uniref:DUF3015 domain-containing protein n=1 Tax=Parasalinivibrio latis TaxID=2952610 RepID=UPI0030E1D588